MLHQFSETIGQIYGAAFSSSSWKAALTAVEHLTRSAGAVVHVVTKNTGLVSFLGASADRHFPQADVEAWTRDLAPKCPRLAAAERWPNAPYVVDRMILSEREMDLDPVYDWYHQHGVRYFIGSPLIREPNIQVAWSLQRTRSHGHADRPDVTLFQLLKPHVSSAVAIAHQLGTLRSHQRFSSSVLEAMPKGIFALNSNGVVLFANARAEAFLDAANGLHLEDGKLRAALPREQPALDRLIYEASLVDIAAVGGWTRVSRPDGGPPYAVFVAPLKVPEEELLAVSASVLVIAHDTGEQRKVDCSMLMAVYGLSGAEARLASALSAGHSLESAAALLGIQVATARSELKSIFKKVGVNRQQDLVRILISVSAMEMREA